MTKPRHFIQNALAATALFLIVAAAGHAAGDPKPENLMAVDLDRAATTRWLNKKVLASRLLDDMENPATWTLQHRGQLSFTQDRFRDGQQSVRITVPTLSDQPNKVHGRSFGEATLSRHFQNEDWMEFNRLSFWVYPTMKGFKNGSMLAKLIYDGSDQEKVSLWYRGQMSGNLAITDPNQELDLKRDAPATAQWTATVVNAKAPWVAVVVPDGNLVQRREVTGKINQP